jgi:hypothetical protein
MKSKSMTKTILALVFSVSLFATGGSAQWISVTLADLPVPAEMALNIVALGATFAIGEIAEPGGCVGDPGSFGRGEPEFESAGDAL